MDNLKITFELCSAMVTSGYPIHLDALVAYAATQRELLFLNKPTQSDFDLIYSELPFEKFEQDGDWVFKASALVAEGDCDHSSAFYTRRTNEVELAVNSVKGNIQYGKMKAGAELNSHALKLDMVRGPQRNLLGYYSTTEVEKVVGYCVGDKERIEEILIDYGFVNHIGKRRRTGHGNIKSITIEIDDSAGDMWKNRVKPWPLSKDDIKIKAAIKAPYWKIDNSIDAFCPKGLA